MKKTILPLFIIPLLLNCQKPTNYDIKLDNFMLGDEGVNVNNLLKSAQYPVESKKKYNYTIDLKKYTYQREALDPVDQINQFFFTVQDVSVDNASYYPFFLYFDKLSFFDIKIDDKELDEVTYSPSEILDYGTYYCYRSFVVFRFFKDTDPHNSKITINLEFRDSSSERIYANYCNREFLD